MTVTLKLAGSVVTHITIKLPLRYEDDWGLAREIVLAIAPEHTRGSLAIDFKYESRGSGVQWPSGTPKERMLLRSIVRQVLKEWRTR